MTMKTTYSENNPISKFLRAISSKDFLSFGKDDIAYVKPVTVEGEKVFAIHAADGTPLSVMDNYSEAVNAISQNDMNAVTLH